MTKLISLGMALDTINKGEYAISHDVQDEGTILSVDNDGWIFVVYTHREYKTYGLNVRRQEVGDAEKRWEIKKIDDFFMDKIDKLEVID